MQLGGHLSIAGCIFLNNGATFGGGALYVSHAVAQILNCTFDSNAAGMIGDYSACGGALYYDFGILNMTDSKFINNTAFKGNAIYAIDTAYDITDSIFINNSNALCTDFDIKSNLINNAYNGDGVSTNNTFYKTFVEGRGLELVLLNNTIDVCDLPSRFDMRDWGWVSPLKSQVFKGFCWVFASFACLESSLLKATGVEYDFSEDYLGSLGLIYGMYGDNRNMEGGLLTTAAGLVLNWFSLVPEEYDCYDVLSKVTNIITDLNEIHLQDLLFIPIKIDNHTLSNETNSLIKQALLKYGSVSLYFDFDEEYVNESSASIYHNDTYFSTHAVAIVGWDDNFSKDNFLITPPGDGAWIIKDSNNGGSFMHVSYYDTSLFAPEEDGEIILSYAIAYIFENIENYTCNYQTDFEGISLFDENYTCYSNEYTAACDGLLGAVGTYFNDTGVEYGFTIYVNGEVKLIPEGISEFAGYRTIVLDKYVPIRKGEKFKIVFTNNVLPYQAFSRQHYMPGVSLASADGKSWIDFATLNQTVCLKAYALADDSIIADNKDMTVDYAGGKFFTVSVVTANGHAVGAGEKVIFTINKKTKTVTTDANGKAKIKITDVPGKYVIKTTYNGNTYTNKVTVKQVLTTSKVTVKKTSGKFTLKAKLKINGKLIKGKWITFKFKGKTYKVKTNSKGIAQKTLGKNVIKKLKKGKTYTVKVSYAEDTIKSAVKVR